MGGSPASRRSSRRRTFERMSGAGAELAGKEQRAEWEVVSAAGVVEPKRARDAAFGQGSTERRVTICMTSPSAPAPASLRLCLRPASRPYKSQPSDHDPSPSRSSASSIPPRSSRTFTLHDHDLAMASSLDHNPPNANRHITAGGSDWLWAVFAIMLLSDLVMVFLTFRVSISR